MEAVHAARKLRMQFNININDKVSKLNQEDPRRYKISFERLDTTKGYLISNMASISYRTQSINTLLSLNKKDNQDESMDQ
ncbi:hypothetical protein DFA_00079 [Cavenderia fasciculata]|uniref:Uncharacterized protein n=1 Tax=Cavenderia fasciculata TaxID=261658 RepID=F4PXJ1_CACFS|nr:uncharacterized protein DFA_00079 [Cavenderia fasciculata]EGG19501.1 hypothetical protein DFA_00079 [Cavenderia fasciculata]|eukprot:XP_004357795.1 hypothetical protein DFA_00079 [Cavenderia fasciculata]